MKILLDDHRLKGWSPSIPENVALRRGELPRREEPLPRPIPDVLLRQIMAEDNLQLVRPDFRVMLLILHEHGFRAGTLVSLAIDCLGEDADGFPTVRWWNTKRRRERLHPVRNPAVVAAIQQQRHRALRCHPGTPWLFPSSHANALGDRHTSAATVVGRFTAYQARIGLTDPAGAAAQVTLHQFRHTFGTRELNNGASQEVVQELLDHDDPKVTRGYARLTDKKLREEFLTAARFNIAGERLDSLGAGGPLADVAWMKEKLNRARVSLPNGYCSLPLQQDCEVQNACLDCKAYFVTTPDFLPAHQAQRDRTAELIRTAEEEGKLRIAQKNRQVLVKLDTLIASLKIASSKATQ
ncbi:tyrosine-type recombinase/integrase [Kineococcus sp. NPDC059986]|uniref:tyrosine-type recombinase/integrase n=1 Tax=Kineococcus sp. NPDC059986 TaxID=3155538 RepID=UPI00344C6B81